MGSAESIPTAAPKRARITWIDALRGLAMVFVVLGHTFPDAGDPLRAWIYSFHMPLFFLVSGLTWRMPKRTFRASLAHSAKNLLLPYAILNIIVYFMKMLLRITFGMYTNRGFFGPLQAFLLGGGEDLPCIQSWFLPTLFLTQIAFYLIMQFCGREWKRAAVLSALFVLGLALSEIPIGPLPWRIAVVPIALMFYYLGYLWMRWEIYERMHPVLSAAAACVLLLVGWYLESCNGRVSMKDNFYANPALFAFSAVCTIAGILLLAILLLHKSRFLQGVGVCSMFYLGYHGFPKTAIGKLFPSLLTTTMGCVAVALADVVLLYPLAQLVTKRCPFLVGKVDLPKKEQ